MKYLLDAQVIIWIATGKVKKLSQDASKILRANDSNFFISIATFWEMAIKMNNGRLDLGMTQDILYELILKTGIGVVPVIKEHIIRLSSLEPIHKDPFDRILITTALTEGMTVLTSDENIQKYDVDWVW